MPGRLQDSLGRRLLGHWLGVASSSAQREITDPDQAWRLVERPDLWELWMPRVQSLLDPARPPRAGARFRVMLRAQPGRLGMAPSGPAHVMIDAYDPQRRLAWRLLSKRLDERYDLRRGGADYRLDGNGAASAAAVLDELERQSVTLL